MTQPSTGTAPTVPVTPATGNTPASDEHCHQCRAHLAPALLPATWCDVHGWVCQLCSAEEDHTWCYVD